MTSRRYRSVVTLSLVSALAVGAAAAPATAGKRTRANAAFAHLRPLSDHTERGIALLATRPRKSSIFLAGLDSDSNYRLRLSTRRCSSVAKRPRRGLLRYRVVIDGFQGTTFDDQAVRSVPRRAVRRARSVVLFGRGDGGRFAPRACGPAFLIIIEALP